MGKFTPTNTGTDFASDGDIHKGNFLILSGTSQVGKTCEVLINFQLNRSKRFMTLKMNAADNKQQTTRTVHSCHNSILSHK
jgi:hypothetical protein